MNNTKTKPVTVTELPDTASPDEVRAEIVKLASEARDIMDAAVVAGRELTTDQERQVTALLAEARRLEARLMAGGNAKGGFVPGAAAAVDALFGPGDSPFGGPVSKGRGGEWAKAVVRANADPSGRYKGLVSPAGAVLVDVPAPPPIEMGRPINNLRSLVPTELSAGQVRYFRQVLRTNNAAPVAPGDRKPTSLFGFDAIDDRARTVAHLSEGVPRQDLSDAPMLQAFLAAEMIFGIEAALEDQMINGNGVGENFTGLGFTPGVLTVPLASAPSMIVRLRAAKTKLERQGINLQGAAYVMSPESWQDVETIFTDDGGLLLNGADQKLPLNSAARRLWGLPVVCSVACPPGVAYLVDAQGSLKLYLTEDIRLDWSEATFRSDAFGPGDGATDWERNLVSWRCEMRAVLAVLRPSGIVKIALA